MGSFMLMPRSIFIILERTPTDWNQGELDFYLNNIKKGRTDLDLLFGCMLDWGVQLSLPMTTEEVDGKMIYTVNDGDLVACFADKVTDKVVKAMADKQPLRVIFRDSCFEQDADKINIYETFKQLLDWSDENVKNNIRVI
jgi:adenine-specific DNA-methyltransferase